MSAGAAARTVARTVARRSGPVIAGALAIAGGAGAARADERAPERARSMIHAEIDPLPFVQHGYGGQIGLRPRGLGGVRLAAASFALDVPDTIAQLGGNEGFSVRVRPSAALYALYYFGRPGEDGLAVGGAVRYLRLRYRHATEPGTAEVQEVSPEVIVAYQLHPAPARWAAGFYLQAWLGLSVTALRDGDRVVGQRTYEPLPVGPFFTVNLGWELGL